MKKNLCSIVFFLLLTNFLFSQTVTPVKPVFIPTQDVVVNFSGFPGNSNDWVAIAPVGYPDDKSSIWYYTGGGSSGSLTFKGLPEGEYEIRGYFKNEYTVRCRANVRIGYTGNANLPQVVTNKSVYPEKESIIVTYSNFAGNSNDWISVAIAGSGDDQSITWVYTDGKPTGTLTFNGLTEGSYEIRGYFKNSYTVSARTSFTVSKSGSTNTNTTTSTTGYKGTPSKLCRNELSVFYAGIMGLGTAWARAAHEPIKPPAESVAAMQAVIGNAKSALEMVKCIPYDPKNIDILNAKLPSLSNAEAVAEIEKVIKEIQTALTKVTLNCGNGTTLSSLFGAGIHMGAAQAHAATRMCMPAPMPTDLQTVIYNHLITAQTSFAGFMDCAPGYPLSLISSVNLKSAISYEPEVMIINIHSGLLWKIALTECCCDCK